MKIRSGKHAEFLTRLRWLLPFFMMTVGVAILAIYDGVTTLINGTLTIPEISLYRAITSAFGIIFIERIRLKSWRSMLEHYLSLQTPFWHMLQGIFFYISSIAFIEAFTGHDPIETYVVSFLHPAWVLVLGVMFLGAKLPSRRTICVILGAFAGVGVILLARMDLKGGEQFPIFGLFAGMAYAAELILSEKAQKVHSTGGFETALYALWINLAISSCIFLIDKEQPHLNYTALGAALTGLMSLAASLAIFYGQQAGKKIIPPVNSDRLAPLDYLILPFAAAFQFVGCKMFGCLQTCKVLKATNWTLFAVGGFLMFGCIFLIMVFSRGEAKETNERQSD